MPNSAQQAVVLLLPEKTIAVAGRIERGIAPKTMIEKLRGNL